MKQSLFRAWLQNKWMEYRSEVNAAEVLNSPSEYFQAYKWFLKALYKEEMRGK